MKVSDGDIKLNFKNGVKIISNFNSEFNLDEKILKRLAKVFKKENLLNRIKFIDGSFNNNISIDLDNTYKLKNYNYSLSGKVKKSSFLVKNSIQKFSQ